MSKHELKTQKGKVKSSSSNFCFRKIPFDFVQLISCFHAFSILDRLTIESSLWNEITTRVSKIDIKLSFFFHVYFFMKCARIILNKSNYITHIVQLFDFLFNR